MIKRAKSFVIGLFALFVLVQNAQADNKPKFTENKGQHPQQVEFSLRVSNADIFFEQDRLTFSFFEGYGDDGHDHKETHGNRAFAYRMNFLNANDAVLIKGIGNKYPGYENFIKGEFSATKVESYDRLIYDEIYEGVDLEYFGINGNLKYDIRVEAGANVGDIQLSYDGAERVFLKKGNLVVVNPLNTVEESVPLAYQVVKGERKRVECVYQLDGNIVSFKLPNGYDQSKELVIDPTLIFSSYTGSTANNFGFTATYDDDGYLYGGGIAFALGYPYITGSYSANFAGVVDMAISKFSQDGTSLIYSTYIGGASTEAPHSMVVNSQGELVILGSTSSLNFPTDASSYDDTFNGGTAVNYVSNGANFENGSDIVIAVLSDDGSSLIGSTYFGGFLNDGLNEDATLSYNYGDLFRGEVIVDSQDNIYITSSTASGNIPVTTGAFDQTLGGNQDACLAKFNSDVSVLDWCSYLGGDGSDAGYSLKLNTTGDVYVTGGTFGQNFPIVGSTLNTTYQGGVADGYIARIANDGSAILSSSFIGTSAYDQSYFVEVDDDNDVYLYGQTLGNYPLGGGIYFNLNGRQFIHKLNPDLTASIYSTVFGSGGPSVNISPTAFLVDVCERVFVSGWGGGTNQSWNNATGNTTGLPVTNDGEQLSTDGSDFYFMVLEADAAALLYGSYFGGNGIQEHVDGGTSRFNKDGVIHQAACAGCGGSNAFPTQPGVVSQINGASCNLGVVKLDLEITGVDVDISGGGSESGCAPLEVEFEADLVNASSYVWYFGDGDTSTVQNPVHIFEDPGIYEVMLIGTDTSFCTGDAFTDTSFTTITVSELTDAADAGLDAHLCPGDSAMVGADSIAGYTYSWSPSVGLDDVNTSNPYADPVEDTEYILSIVNPDGCEDFDTVQVTVFSVLAFPDTSICANDSVLITVQGGTSFSWDPVVGVGDPTSPTPYITAGFAETYTVTASDGAGCEAEAQVNLEALAAPTALFDVEISQSCEGDSVQFINLSDGADSYSWNLGGVTTEESDPIILFEPGAEPIVTLTAYNNNGECTDSITVDFSDGWFTEDSLAITYGNVFTPNGDQVNDCFQPNFHGDLYDCFELKVFSRWGRLLFDSDKHGGPCWDGTQRTGDLVAEGTYYYIAKVRGMDHAGYVMVIYE